MRTTPLMLAALVACLAIGCDEPSASSEAAPSEGTAAVPEPEPKPATKKQPEKLELTDDQWRERLTPEEFHVLRKAGTERPFTGEYDHHFEPGAYACAACGQVLFESDAKFNSGCGWPAFYAAKAGDRVNLHEDLTHGMIRVEVTCARCDSHLGHVFDDAPQTPTGQRYCINSVSLKFIPGEGEDASEKPSE